MGTPRYLTAQKISLLVLIRLYCTAPLPPSATIPVLSFLVSHMVIAYASSPSPSPSGCRALARPSPEDHTTCSISAFEKVLQGHASSIPGRTLVDLFLKHMWDLNSFDSLADLFDLLGDLFAHGPEADDQPQRCIGLSLTSPLGAFVRRARVEFTRLQFDDAMQLWSSLIRYRAPTAQWTTSLAGIAAAARGVDMVAAEMALRPNDALHQAVYGHGEHDYVDEGRSSDHLDRILDFQLDRLQRFGDDVPEKMRHQLRQMLGSSGVVHRQAHLVQFFHAWKVGDYTASFDHLHRYYDYAMQTRDRIHNQYALLHMAILHADFGCFAEAIAAITETISTARESQDMTCLSFSLSWLTHMAKAYPNQMKAAGYMNKPGSERDVLAFLKAKARDSKMYNMLSATLLNEARLTLWTGDSVSRAFEQLYQSSHLNTRENISNHACHLLLQSTLYSRLGLPHMANVHCELLLDCYATSCLLDEHIRALGRRAFIMTYTGRYDQAIAILEAIHPKVHKSLKHNQYLILCIGVIKLKRAIRRSDWTTCTHLLTTLKPQPNPDPSSTPLDPELSFLLHETHIDYLTSRARYPEASALISTLFHSCTQDNADVLDRIIILLSQADLLRKIGHAERGFAPAIRAATLSYRAKLTPSLCAAVGMLANILNGLGECATARKLLQSMIPHAIQGTDTFLIGTMYSHLADAYMGLANPNANPHPSAQDLASLGSSESEKATCWTAANLAKAEIYMDRARECFGQSEYLAGECDMLMKKALLAKLRGEEKLADEWAQIHNRVWDEGMNRVEE